MFFTVENAISYKAADRHITFKVSGLKDLLKVRAHSRHILYNLAKPFTSIYGVRPWILFLTKGI
jgi:hypothetical protein